MLSEQFLLFYYSKMTVENQEKPAVETAESKSDLLIKIVETNGALTDEKIDKERYRSKEGFAVVADIVVDMLTYLANTLNDQSESMKKLIFQYSKDEKGLLMAIDELIDKVLSITGKNDDKQVTISLLEDVHELLLKYGIDHLQYLPAEPTKENE